LLSAGKTDEYILSADKKFNYTQNLNRIRTTRGMSLRDLADAADMSPSFLSQIENSKTSPSISSLQKAGKSSGFLAFHVEILSSLL